MVSEDVIDTQDEDVPLCDEDIDILESWPEDGNELTLRLFNYWSHSTWLLV